MVKLNQGKKMNLKYNENTKFLKIDDEPIQVSGIIDKSPAGVLNGLLGNRMYSMEYKRIRITEKKLLTHYIKVDNFNFVEYSKPQKQFVFYNQVYKHNIYDFFIVVDIDLENIHDNLGEINEKGVYKVSTLYYDSSDKTLSKNTAIELNKTTFVNNDSSSKVSVLLSSSNGIVFKEHSIKPLPVDIKTMYNDDFQIVHNRIINKLNNTNKGIIMLHGAAGTGKTNYIKHLTTLVPKKRFVFVPVSTIPSLTDPSFIGKLIDNKGAILVLEDSEEFIRKRGSNDNSNVVSSILNLTDGILSDILGVQIICTFNTTLQNIDDALLRKGRLIAEYEFNKLSEDKVKLLIGNFVKSPESMTLAEIFNYNNVEIKKQKEIKKIGF